MRKLFKKSFLWIVLSVFLFPAVPATAQIRVTIATVFQEYSENIVRADQRYDGQTVELIGRVSGNIRSGRNPRTERDEFYVVLIDRSPYASGGIRAFFSAGNRNQVARLDQEQDVIIRGRFNRINDAGRRRFVLTNSSVVSVGATRDERYEQEVAQWQEQFEQFLEQEQREREEREKRWREADEAHRLAEEARQREIEEARQLAEQERIRQEEELARQVRELDTSFEGVVINDVRWATRNVGFPGKFADAPEDRGMNFRKHRDGRNNLTLRPNDQRIVRELNERPSRERRRNPHPVCPPGWRVPTKPEIQFLIDAGSVWAVKNDVSGLLFGTYPNQIFLPQTSNPHNPHLPSNYWSSTQSMFSTYRLNFFSIIATERGSARERFAFSRGGSGCLGYIRCVADN